MPKEVAAATLDFYAPLTDPDGPAMTDSVHAIDAAAIGEPGCADVHLPDADDPAVRARALRAVRGGARRQGRRPGPPLGRARPHLHHRVRRLHAGLHPRPDGPAPARGPHPPRPHAAAADEGRRHGHRAGLAGADVRHRDRRRADHRDPDRGRAVHDRVTRGTAHGEPRDAADTEDPAAGPHRDRQRRPLRAVASDVGGARPLRGGRRGRQRRDRVGARRRPGQPHRRPRAADADRADRDRLERAAARVLPGPRLSRRRPLDGGRCGRDRCAPAADRRPVRARRGPGRGRDRRSGIRELEVIRAR